MHPSVVAIRTPTLNDADELMGLQAASRDHLRPWVEPFRSREAFAEWVDRSALSTYNVNLICRRSDGVILGAANLSQIHMGPLCSAYLGYWIGAPFAGQGLMRAGLRLLLDRAFGPLGLHRVEANIQPRNLASIGLVRSLGFRCEGYSPRYLKIGGRWRDHERWALLAEEWRTERASRSRASAGRSPRAASGPPRRGMRS